MYCIDTELGPRLLDLLLISRSSVRVGHPCCIPPLEVLAKETGISMTEINLAGFQTVQCASIMLMGLGKWSHKSESEDSDNDPQRSLILQVAGYER